MQVNKRRRHTGRRNPLPGYVALVLLALLVCVLLLRQCEPIEAACYWEAMV